MEIGSCRAGERTVRYLRVGNGPRPLLVLPGLSVTSVLDSAEAIRGAFSLFGKTHTVYLPDRPDPVTPGYGVFEMAEDTADMMERLGLRGADIFGASQGGMIALCLAARHPGSVHALVVASSTAHVKGPARAIIPEWERLAREGDVRALNRSFAEIVYSEAYRDTYARAFAAIEGRGTPEELARFAILAHAASDFDARDLLPCVVCPVLAVNSRDDRLFGAEGAEEIATGIGENAQCFLYEGYGHAVYDEAPDFRPRMAAFFAGKDF